MSFFAVGVCRRASKIVGTGCSVKQESSIVECLIVFKGTRVAEPATICSLELPARNEFLFLGRPSFAFSFASAFSFCFRFCFRSFFCSTHDVFHVIVEAFVPVIVVCTRKTFDRSGARYVFVFFLLLRPLFFRNLLWFFSRTCGCGRFEFVMVNRLFSFSSCSSECGLHPERTSSCLELSNMLRRILFSESHCQRNV